MFPMSTNKLISERHLTREGQGLCELVTINYFSSSYQMERKSCDMEDQQVTFDWGKCVTFLVDISFGVKKY